MPLDLFTAEPTKAKYHQELALGLTWTLYVNYHGHSRHRVALFSNEHDAKIAAELHNKASKSIGMWR